MQRAFGSPPTQLTVNQAACNYRCHFTALDTLPTTGVTYSSCFKLQIATWDVSSNTFLNKVSFVQFHITHIAQTPSPLCHRRSQLEMYSLQTDTSQNADTHFHTSTSQQVCSFRHSSARHASNSKVHAYTAQHPNRCYQLAFLPAPRP
jgi:hypothetical protein